MILQDIQIRVKRTFGDEGGVQIEDADIARWATDAQLDIVKETKCNQTQTSLAMAEGTTDYIVAQSISISSVTVNGKALRAISSTELNQRYPDRAASGYGSGTPEYFTARDGGVGTVITLFPMPDATAATIQVTHNTRPLPVVNPADAFTIPEEYQDIIFRKCLERAYELDGQWTAAKTVRDDAADKTVNARADSREKDDDSYPAIRCLPGDMG